MKREVTDRLRSELARCCGILNEGGILLYPTDTVWGIGCDASNKPAVDRILDLKGRRSTKSLILLVSSEKMLKDTVAEVPDLARDLIEFTTVPMTIVYSKSGNAFPASIDGSLAVRLVKRGFVHELVRKFGKPITSTSANFNSEPTPLNFDDIKKEISERMDHVVPKEFDDCSSNKPSRIISIKPDGEIHIIR